MGKAWTYHPLRVLVSALSGSLLGCASPGQPGPPSLFLPQIAGDLSAERTGDTVHLRWTTPSATTDNLPVGSQISAVICRETATVGAGLGHSPCVEIKRFAAHPGPSEADDVLAGGMIADPVTPLAYRVSILNRAGRSAGRSPEAFAAAGAAPPAVQEFRGSPMRGGVRLQWRPESGADQIELDRVTLTANGAVMPPKTHGPMLPAPSKAQGEVHLGARAMGDPDAGGTLDRSAQKGVTYRYTAQRVRPVVAGGHAMAIRSVVSPAVTVQVLDTFPPKPPTGLEAAAGSGDQPSIDLSWQPGAEGDLAGYNVYRSELPPSGSAAAGASWHRLNSAIIAVPGFTDAEVRAGSRYGYRVTAVDTGGNESAPGNEVQGTPATR